MVWAVNGGGSSQNGRTSFAVILKNRVYIVIHIYIYIETVKLGETFPVPCWKYCKGVVSYYKTTYHVSLYVLQHVDL